MHCPPTRSTFTLIHSSLPQALAVQQVAARRARARVEEAEGVEASRARKRDAEKELADAVEGVADAAAAVPAAQTVFPLVIS